MAYYILLHHPACLPLGYQPSRPQSNEDLEHPQSVIFKSRPAAAEASKWCGNFNASSFGWWLMSSSRWWGGGMYVSLSSVSHFVGEGIKRALAMM